MPQVRLNVQIALEPFGTWTGPIEVTDAQRKKLQESIGGKLGDALVDLLDKNRVIEDAVEEGGMLADVILYGIEDMVEEPMDTVFQVNLMAPWGVPLLIMRRPAEESEAKYARVDGEIELTSEDGQNECTLEIKRTEVTKVNGKEAKILVAEEPIQDRGPENPDQVGCAQSFFSLFGFWPVEDLYAPYVQLTEKGMQATNRKVTNDQQLTHAFARLGELEKQVGVLMARSLVGKESEEVKS
jgi:hypothetical protein